MPSYPVGTRVEVMFEGAWVEGVVETSPYETLYIVYTDVFGSLDVTHDYEYIHRLESVKPRENSFVNWMKKLEGKKDDYTVTEKETRSGFGEGIDLLHEFLSRHIKFRDFQSRRGSLDLEERQALDRERRRLGVRYFRTDSMGLYDGDRSALEQSVEYLTSNQASERQDEVPPSSYISTTRPSSVFGRLPKLSATDFNWSSIWTTSTAAE